MARSRSAAPSPTRFARVYTWQPDTRVERTVLRRRLPFSGDVRDLIRRAADLVALHPWRVDVSFFPKHYHLTLSFGQDARGIQTCVSVTLHATDGEVLAYFARDRSVRGVLFLDLPADDGEDLPIPRVSVDELARMETTTGVA